MRIWYQSMAPIRHLGNYTASLARHAGAACSPGVEVVFNGASEEPYAPGSHAPSRAFRPAPRGAFTAFRAFRSIMFSPEIRCESKRPSSCRSWARTITRSMSGYA